MYIDTYSNLKKAKPIFKTKKGQLTAYSLQCGYCERKETKQVWKTMFFEHSVYHVQTNKPIYNNEITRCYSMWETYDNITDARKKYNSIKLTKN